MSDMSGSGSGIADSLNGVKMSSLKEVVMVVQAELGSEAVEVLGHALGF
jgi:hypothetical protein